MTHALKTWPEYYEKVISEEKRFEVRKFDRPFNEGDFLLLQEYSEEDFPHQNGYSGKEQLFVIDYIFTGEGVKEGFCVMSISSKEY